MRIAMLADLYRPHISGVTVHIDQLKAALERRGHSVWVFTFGQEQPGDAQGNVIRSAPLPLSLRYGETALQTGIRLDQRALSLLQSMDVIHAHHPLPMGWLALRHRRGGVPVLFTTHTRYDLHLEAALTRWLASLGFPLLRRYLGWLCRSCDQVISPSESMRQRLRSWGIDCRIEIVRHGIDLSPFRAPCPRQAMRARWGCRPDDCLLIYTGRLGREKNLEELLAAFEPLTRQNERLALQIVGGGPDRRRLQRIGERFPPGRVRFEGCLPPERIPGCLMAADVFVTPSRSEVYPLSVIEALAAGLPVVGFRSPGLDELVDSGQTGLLASCSQELSAHLERLSADPALRRRMSLAARACSASFGIDAAAERLSKCYRTACSIRAGQQAGGGS